MTHTEWILLAQDLEIGLDALEILENYAGVDISNILTL